MWNSLLITLERQTAKMEKRSNKSGAGVDGRDRFFSHNTDIQGSLTQREGMEANGVPNKYCFLGFINLSSYLITSILT